MPGWLWMTFSPAEKKIYQRPLQPSDEDRFYLWTILGVAFVAGSPHPLISVFPVVDDLAGRYQWGPTAYMDLFTISCYTTAAAAFTRSLFKRFPPEYVCICSLLYMTFTSFLCNLVIHVFPNAFWLFVFATASGLANLLIAQGSSLDLLSPLVSVRNRTVILGTTTSMISLNSALWSMVLTAITAFCPNRYVSRIYIAMGFFLHGACAAIVTYVIFKWKYKRDPKFSVVALVFGTRKTTENEPLHKQWEAEMLDTAPPAVAVGTVAIAPAAGPVAAVAIPGSPTSPSHTEPTTPITPHDPTYFPHLPDDAFIAVEQPMATILMWFIITNIICACGTLLASHLLKHPVLQGCLVVVTCVQIGLLWTSPTLVLPNLAKREAKFWWLAKRRTLISPDTPFNVDRDVNDTNYGAMESYEHAMITGNNDYGSFSSSPYVLRQSVDNWPGEKKAKKTVMSPVTPVPTAKSTSTSLFLPALHHWTIEWIALYLLIISLSIVVGISQTTMYMGPVISYALFDTPAGAAYATTPTKVFSSISVLSALGLCSTAIGKVVAHAFSHAMKRLYNFLKKQQEEEKQEQRISAAGASYGTAVASPTTASPRVKKIAEPTYEELSAEARFLIFLCILTTIGVCCTVFFLPIVPSIVGALIGIAGSQFLSGFTYTYGLGLTSFVFDSSVVGTVGGSLIAGYHLVKAMMFQFVGRPALIAESQNPGSYYFVGSSRMCLGVGCYRLIMVISTVFTAAAVVTFAILWYLVWRAANLRKKMLKDANN